MKGGNRSRAKHLVSKQRRDDRKNLIYDNVFIVVVTHCDGLSKKNSIHLLYHNDVLLNLKYSM